MKDLIKKMWIKIKGLFSKLKIYLFDLVRIIVFFKTGFDPRIIAISDLIINHLKKGTFDLGVLIKDVYNRICDLPDEKKQKIIDWFNQNVRVPFDGLEFILNQTAIMIIYRGRHVIYDIKNHALLYEQV